MRSKRYKRRLIGAGVLALSGLAVAALGPAWASTALSTSGQGSTSAPATAATAGDPLPDRIVGGYWQIEPLPDEDANGKDRETGSAHLTVADITKGAPQYNLLFASFAYLHKGDEGVAFYPPKSDEPKVDPKAEIAASRAAGARWMLSVGGDGGTVPLSSGPDAANLVNQLVSIVDEYGFDGVDFDVECKASEGDACWTKDAMREAVLGLKKHYQDRHFLISFAPSPASKQYRGPGR